MGEVTKLAQHSSSSQHAIWGERKKEERRKEHVWKMAGVRQEEIDSVIGKQLGYHKGYIVSSQDE